MPNETSIMEQVLAFHDKYDFNSFTAKDVQNALNKDRIDFYDYAALLSPAALPFLEKMARKSSAMYEEAVRQHNSSFHTNLYCKLLRKSVRLLWL